MKRILPFIPKKLLIILIGLTIAPCLLPPAYSQMRKVYLDTAPDNVIRKISFYSPSQGYVAFSDWIGYTSDSGRTFTKKYVTQTNVDYGAYNINLTFGFWIEGVKAFNRDTLIAYGHYGLVPAVLYSADGGNNFKLVFHSNQFPTAFKSGITDMIFPEDNKTGFAVDADRVLKTSDGGLTWSRVYLDPDAYYTDLGAVSKSQVYAFNTNHNKIVWTRNGGTTWVKPRMPSGTLSALYFSTINIGWVSMYDGSKSNLYKTTDQSTWTLVNDPDAVSILIRKMKFVNDTTAYALSGQNTVFKTTDGGRIWEPLPRDNDFSYLGYTHNDLHFWNSNQFWAGGGHGFLEMTNNAGGTPLPTAYFKFDTTGTIPGGNVKLVNFSKAGYQYSWYINGVFISNNYQASYRHVFTRDRDTVKLIVRNGMSIDSVTKYQNFVVPPIPIINTFSPATGSTGTMVTIEGVNFSDVTGVSFGGVPATSYGIASSTMIRAIVGNGSTGDIGLTTIYGTFSYPGFTYFAPPASPPPIVTSFTPSSGLIGTTVTINGSNFNTDPSGNIVSFGATKATVSSASSTQIVCSVPAGASYLPVSVLNKSNGLTGYSKKPFNVVFADSSNFTVNSFVVPVMSFSYSGNYPQMPEAADLDGDGKPDLIYGTWRAGPDSIYIHRNTSTGGNFSFAPKTHFQSETGNGSGIISLKDLDGDGKPDIVSPTNQGYINVYLNTSVPGNISFLPEMRVPTGGATWEIAIDDLDGDGKPDLAIAGGGLSILRNTSSPGHLSFAASVSYQTSVVSVAIGDLDGDNKKDVVSFSGNTFFYFKNLSSAGNIVLSPKSGIPVIDQGGFTGRNTFIMDIDGDNRQEVVLLNDYGCHVFRNTSTGGDISFAPEFSHNVYGYAQGLTIANLSGDNKPDLLMGNATSSYMYLFRNISVTDTIKTDPIVSVSAGNSPSFTNAADFNLDGKADIVFSAGYHVSILKNSLGDKIPVPLCSDGDGAILSDLAGTTYQWQQKKGSTFVNITDNSNFSGTKSSQLNLTTIPLSMRESLFRCIIDGNLSSSTFVLKITYRTVPEVTISASTTNVCYGSSVTFNATSHNVEGYYDAYLWQVNGITVSNILSPTYTTAALNNNDQVRVILIKFDECTTRLRDTSNIITMSVTGGQPSVAISTTTTSICQGSSLTFSATSINAGTPSYQWQVNGVNTGTNSNTFTSSTLNNSDKVSVIMTANGTCLPSNPVTSNTINIAVASTALPSVTISTPSTSVCEGSIVSFLATPTNGGNSPSYQWQVNGLNKGNNNNAFTSFSVSNGDEVKVIITSNASCNSNSTATSNIIIMSVGSPVTPSVSITSSSVSICSGSTVTFTAVPGNGGSLPSYQWQLNGVNTGTNSNIYTSSSLSNDDEIKVIMTSNASCVTTNATASNIISMSVREAVVPAVNIAASATSICENTPVTFTATVINEGNTPSWQWQIDGMDAGDNSNTFSTSSLINGSQVKVILTSSAACASPAIIESNIVGMTVNAPVIPAVVISPSAVTICSGTSVTFTAGVTNEGTNPVYQWKNNGLNVGTNSSTYSTNSLANGDVIFLALTSNTSCGVPVSAASNEVIVAVNPATPEPGINISGSTTVVEGQAALISANATNAGATPVYEWQDSTNTHNWQTIPGAFTVQLNYTPAHTGDKIRCILTSNAACINQPIIASNALLFTVTTVTAIDPVPASRYNIQLYPNPVNFVFTIDTLRMAERWQSLEIVSIDGKNQLLLKNIGNQSRVTVDVSSLSAGVYIVILRRKSGDLAYLKFVKQ